MRSKYHKQQSLYPFSPVKKQKRQKNKKINWKHIFLKIILWLWILWLITSFFLYRIIIVNNLPDVSKVKNMVFSQATFIEDRHWKLLYKLFNQNREYVAYSWISNNMINAIVSMEDQRYREHWWLDPKWIIRAWLSFVFPFLWDPWWWSTLTQQLIKNILLNKHLSNETTKEKIIRKLKEFALTSRLKNELEKQIKKEKWKLNKDNLDKEIKKFTLELYLNYISFWNNAYWIESASKTYFNVHAKDLTILQSSILSSIPKWPTKYNPIRHYDRVLWKINIYDDNNEIINLWSWTKNILKNAKSKLINLIKNSNISQNNKNFDFTKFISWLWNFSFLYNWKTYKAEYRFWRKDSSLSRMYQDWHITEAQLKSAFIEWLNLTFSKPRFEIKAPHFVQRVIEELEKKYDKETLYNWWLIIKTTLDYDIQKIAENEIKNNKKNLEYYWANNESMMYIDSKNWDVLAYVWSIDYFNENIEWQNDMLRSARQVWSSIKPLIYTIWFKFLPLTEDTPIFDIPFRVWWLNPHNADWKYLWLLPLRQALCYSRNIPAIKMILAAWWEWRVKPILRQMWLKTLSTWRNYWYSLALWAWEIPIIELVKGYSHISARWKPAKINPILEIKTKEWNILYEKKIKYEKQIIEEWIAYIIRHILSNPANMPPWRVHLYTVRWLNLWIKSWTSNMKTKRWDRARDWLLVWITPSKVAIFWAWNTNWSPMYKNAYWWMINHKPLQWFYSKLLKNNYIKKETMKPINTSYVTISKISWRLAWKWTPPQYQIKTMWFSKTTPWKVDPWMKHIKVDKLCNWKISDYTPKKDIINWYLITPISFMPNQMDLNNIKKWFNELNTRTWQNNKYKRNKYVSYNLQNLFIKEPKNQCTERIPTIDKNINISILSPNNNSKTTNNFDIKYKIWWNSYINKVIIKLNNNVIKEIEYNSKKNFVDIQNIKLENIQNNKKHLLILEVITTNWTYNKKWISIEIVDKDNTPPILSKKNIRKDWDKYKITLLFNDELSAVLWWKIESWWNEIKSFEWWLVSFETTYLWTIKYIVFDSKNNILKWNLDLTSL